MSNILNNLMGLFGQDEINTLSNQIGAEPTQTASALQSAVPTLLNALNNNASQGGANGILAALDRDHDGSILDDVMGFFQNGGNGDGNGILKHLLGENKGNVENALAASSGLNAGSISKLLPLIAPIIMGFLGKQKKGKWHSRCWWIIRPNRSISWWTRWIGYWQLNWHVYRW